MQWLGKIPATIRGDVHFRGDLVKCNTQFYCVKNKMEHYKENQVKRLNTGMLRIFLCYIELVEKISREIETKKKQKESD